jgi:hypothetical protein
MEKDLIIGGASNYTWDQLKYWVNSIRKSGFKGDVAIVGSNMKKETIEKRPFCEVARVKILV